jgi:hypothetical protein
MTKKPNILDANGLMKYVASYKKKPASGIDCEYIALTKEWGIKTYRHQSTRDEAYLNQARMSGYGYAPRVGIKFDCAGRDWPVEKFCYITEVAKVLIERADEWEHYRNEEKKLLKKQPKLPSKVEQLIVAMEEAGFDFCDTHYGNFGRLRRKLVCIDFS